MNRNKRKLGDLYPEKQFDGANDSDSSNSESEDDSVNSDEETAIGKKVHSESDEGSDDGQEAEKAPDIEDDGDSDEAEADADADAGGGGGDREEEGDDEEAEEEEDDEEEEEEEEEEAEEAEAEAEAEADADADADVDEDKGAQPEDHSDREEEEEEDVKPGIEASDDERSEEEQEELKPNISASEHGEDEDEDEEIAVKKPLDTDSDSSDDGEGRKIEQAADANDVLADLDLDDDDDEDEDKEEKVVKEEIFGRDDDDERDDREEEQEEIPITRIEVEIPKIPTELGNDIHFVKLPNFLSVDTHPYDPSWYEDEIDEDEIMDEEGRHRLKLKVESTIRWRTVVDETGESQRESNARIVKWSDGSMSLHLGSEIFDIHKQSLMAGDNNHLFIRQGTGLQGQAVFKTKLTFRPHSTDSFTHRKMTLSLAERSHKTQKIRVLPNVGKDPEAHRSEMIKKEEDKLKASIRRENKMRRVREKAPFRGPTASYLEPDAYDDDDDDNSVSLSAIKKRYKKGGAGYNIYTDSDDDSDLEKKKGSSERKRTAKVNDSDEDE